MLIYALAFIILILIDIPWLTFQLSASKAMILKIQQSPMAMRLWAAPVVYVALAYLLVQQKTTAQAAAAGLATYAVYDFTNLAIFKDYPVSFAVQDSLWGGALFAISHNVLKYSASYLKVPSPV
jgi:uncharacterized membrane protein